MTAVQTFTHELPVAPSAPRSMTGSMTELLTLAVEKGTPVAELKELVALHKEMHQMQAQQDFAAAMASFQRECPSIKKSSKADITTRGGGNMKYTFAELDEIANTVNPILAKYGLSYSFNSVQTKDTLRCICTVRHMNGHSLDSTIELPVDNPSAMSGQQKVGSAMTFARRLSLTAALGLTTTDRDLDGADDQSVISIEQAEELAGQLAAKCVGRNEEETRARYFKALKVGSFGAIKLRDYGRALKLITDMKAAKVTP